MIEINEELINQKRDLTIEKKRKKSCLLQINQTRILEIENQQKEKIVSKIKKNEQFYRNQLNQQNKEAQEIEEQIKRIIEDETRKARDQPEKNNSGSPLTPESLELSSKFELNKGKPAVSQTKLQRNTVYKNKHIRIETKNNEIDFDTDEGQPVRVVFDGKVSRIFYIKGKGKAVLVRHGEYFTVYSGLKGVVVKSGEKVISKQKIGTVVTSDSSGETELHFEIWKGKDPQNPELNGLTSK